MKLIDKDALVVEIERRFKEHDSKKRDYASTDHFWRAIEDKDILSFINTIELKEVNLEKELNIYLEKVKETDEDIVFKDFAKHFFELGMQVSNKQIEEKRYIKTGIELIAEERQRQIDVEGYSKEHDLQHDEGEFLDAAAAYMTPNIKRPCIDVTYELNNQPSYAVTYDLPSSDGTIHKMRVLPPRTWPFGEQYWKPTPLDRVRELVKAGALIAAAIDRLRAQKGK